MFHTGLMGKVAEGSSSTCFSLLYFTGQTVQIVSPHPPISFSVGTNVTFHCEATASKSALWEVNTTQLAGPHTQGSFAARGIITEPGPILQEIGNISYTLYALASFENNRTVIRCQASMGVPPSYVSSKSVTLLVFGECFFNQATQYFQMLPGPFPDFLGGAWG